MQKLTERLLQIGLGVVIVLAIGYGIVCVAMIYGALKFIFGV